MRKETVSTPVSVFGDNRNALKQAFIAVACDVDCDSDAVDMNIPRAFVGVGVERSFKGSPSCTSYWRDDSVWQSLHVVI